MVKYLLNFLLIFLMLSPVAFARSSDAKLKGEYGPNLTSAPFFLRFSFSGRYHKDWKKSSYAERKAFLTDYDNNVAAERAQARAQARADAAYQRAQARAIRDAQRRERDQERAEAAEQRAEAKAQEDRNKAFNSAVQGQQRELQQAEQSIQGN